MLNTSSLSTFLNSIQSMALVELILLYFVGFSLATIIKNVLGTEVTTAFNFNKKVASGFVVFYLLLEVSKFSKIITNSQPDPFSFVIMNVTCLVIALLVLYVILTSEWFMRSYRFFYAFLVLTWAQRNPKLTLKTLRKIIYPHLPSRPDDLYSQTHYLNHLMMHFPNYLVSLILIFAGAHQDFHVLCGSIAISLILIVTSFFVELKDRTNLWGTNPYAFGLQVRKVIYPEDY